MKSPHEIYKKIVRLDWSMLGVEIHMLSSSVLMEHQRKNFGPEQRRSERYKVEFEVKVHLSQDGKTSSSPGTATNVGEGGMQLFISKDLAVGQVIRLELSLPYKRTTLKLRAVIRNRLGFKYGVEFRNLTEHDQEIILQNCRVLSLLQ